MTAGLPPDDQYTDFMQHLRRLVVGLLTCVLLAHAVPAQAADPNDANLTASWLARTLASNNDLAQNPAGDVDYASTAYALLGLKAAGVAADQIRASAEAMAASEDAFVGTPDQADSKTTAISLMILAMQAGDLDPAEYLGSGGTRDLYADLQSTIQPDGAVSTMATAYGQSFAILALLGSGTVPDPVVAWLLAQPCADSSSPGFGGYGFAGPGSCDDADPDSTALAVIALVNFGISAATLDPARTFLTSVQDSSGGFISTFSGINANTTGLAVAALNALSPGSAEASKGVDFLESLMYGCDAGTDLAGAMALTADARTSTQIAPLADSDRALFFQASAQGIYGFVGMAPPATYAFGSVDAPVPSCPTPSPDTAADSSGASDWWWALGGFLVVVLVYVGWRFIISGRRS